MPIQIRNASIFDGEMLMLVCVCAGRGDGDASTITGPGAWKYRPSGAADKHHVGAAASAGQSPGTLQSFKFT